MARKSHLGEFRQRAVHSYEFTPGSPLKIIPADLAIARAALRECVEKRGSWTTTAGTGLVPPARRAESHAARIARLEAELKAEILKLETERYILCRTVK